MSAEDDFDALMDDCAQDLDKKLEISEAAPPKEEPKISEVSDVADQEEKKESQDLHEKKPEENMTA